MTRLNRSLGMAAACGSLALLCSTSIAFASGPPTTSIDLAAIEQHFHVRVLGRAPAALPMEVAVALNYRHAQEMERLAYEQAIPKSPLYHHFLSNSQFNAYFAPLPSDYIRVQNYLRAQGFTIVKTYGNRVIVDAAAPAAVVERTFSTEIHLVYQAGEGQRYMNTRMPVMPSVIADVVRGVVGLDNLVKVKPLMAPEHAVPLNQQSLPDVSSGPLNGPGSTGGYGPLAFTNGYDYPIMHGYDGSGRSVGVVEIGNFLNSDLQKFLNYFHVKRTGPLPSRIVVNGKIFNGGGGGGAEEATGDAEAIESAAPGVHLLIYYFDVRTGMKGEAEVWNQVVSDNYVDVFSNSVGASGELKSDIPTYQLMDDIATEGAVKGITFSAASGDSGALNFDVLAAFPHVVGVGGTNLTVYNDGSYRRETGARFSSGGVSQVWPLPTYQQGIPHMIGTSRNIPDVAFFAGTPGFAYLFYGYFRYPFEGTSLASPLYAGMQVELNQMQGSRSGFVNPTLYQTFTNAGYGVFHDITEGCTYPNGPNGSKNCTKHGYDLVTGIGSIDGYLYGTDLVGGSK